MVTPQTGTETRQDIFNAFFILNTNGGLRRSQHPKLEDHGSESDEIPVDPDLVRDLLLHLDPYKSMGPDGIYPRTLNELADVISRTLVMIYEYSWESREIPGD
ncbi:hypothetical protein HGM15179_013477 [Zosterops borbonicus]|uniref:Uncharacterized protein n=1 Tax=Zosterops borbonicus TaxID=364589 RepID=A0A8K1LH80_9PASS|nr:hypothetical protein HGM15179_013477 [Zosterops borbonicus]